jgi:undecaprenyl diphosphate synthase
MNIPRHIGIIMDGNGRWAQKRGLPKNLGHRSGADTAEKIIEDCARKGIQALTLYAFSSENWNRPEKEIKMLMSMFKDFLKRKKNKLIGNNIVFQVIGRRGALPQDLKDEVAKVENETSKNDGLILSLAVNYGGRQEITDAFKLLNTKLAENGKDFSSVNEQDIDQCLYTSNLPELDLIIRTSGEMRISNFLLWQAAYSEFFVTETLWPDFSIDEFEKALENFDQRDRRFGG